MDAFYQGRSVLVTGGCGFIGSHLVDALVLGGARVRVLGSYSSSGTWGNLERYRNSDADIDVRLGTVTDPSFVASCVDGQDVVFHLAALIGIPYSYVAPEHYVQTNVVGTLNVLEAVRRHETPRLVHTSTSECFGSAQSVPMSELHPISAQSPYAATKVAADQLAGSYWRSFGTPAVTVRPFNTFGPRQTLRAVVPTVIAQALVGPRVRLGSVTPLRDLNPVQNTVTAMMLAGSVAGIEGELFVVGSGVERSIGDVVEAVGEVIGRPIEIETDERRIRPDASEVDRLWCDYSKARALLGYEPTVSFMDSLKETVEWMRDIRVDPVSYAV
jgi:NAD dependent epimerase/dehydratase